MKTMKKALALVLSLAIVMSLGIAAFAATPTLTVVNPSKEIVMDGQEITVYKLFNMTYDAAANGGKGAYSYTLCDKLDNPTAENEPANIFRPTGGGEIKPSQYIDYVKNNGKNAKLQEFANFIIGRAEAMKLDKVAVTASGESQVINMDTLGQGYFVIKVAPKGPNGEATVPAVAVSTDSNDENTTVYVKAELPHIDKDVKGPGENYGDDEAADSAVVKVGDQVDFKLTAKVPNYNGYDTYKFSFLDTASAGLNIDYASFSVTVKNSSKILTLDPSDYTITETDAQNFQLDLGAAKNGDLIAFIDGYNRNKADEDQIHIGDTITVNYKATVTEASLTSTSEKNEAKLNYSNNPTTGGNGDSNKTNTYVYSVDLDITKVDGAEENKVHGSFAPVADAVFILKNSDGNVYKYTETDPGTGKVTWVARGEADANLKKDPSEATVMITNADGKLVVAKWDGAKWIDDPTIDGVAKFQGLDEGNYLLEELVAPAGFNKLAKDVKIGIVANKEASDNGNKGNVVSVTYTIQTPKADGDYNNPEVVTKDVASAGGVHIGNDVMVKNVTGGRLPSTGGVGTTIFYTIGAVMMAAALVLMITKKKMSVN